LKLSQPAMSRQISKLEKHLRYPLFTRNRGGVKLTRKGEELLSVVESTFLGLRGFTHNTHALTKITRKRKIKIATSYAVATYVINDLILEYSIKNPNVVFEIIARDDVLDVILNDVDIAICPYDPHLQGVIQEPLLTLQKKLYASEKYLAQYKEPRKVEDLKDHRLIAISSNAENYPYADVNWILKLGLPEGKLHEASFFSNSIECMVSAAIRGIGIIASYDEMAILKDARLKNILPNVTDNMVKEYFIYPKHLKGDNDIIDIKNYLQKTLLFNDT
jgi:DNA-binding transcriptional LysR family regulator